MPHAKTPTLDDSGLAPGDDDWLPPAPVVAQRGESFGRYVVLREIGSGGMGVVYAAYDPELDRRVALKVLGRAAADETARARLLREAQTMASISHPNVITVHDVGEVDGRLFIAMELVDGLDLERWLAEGDHAWSDVLGVLVQAGRGLAAAHAQGLIHRDFKPANVLVGNDGLVRVLDFGLARRFGSSGEDVHVSDTADVETSSSHGSHSEQLTRTGAVAGTPAYMSPEQHARADLDAKSDQFSFCVTAFEALFGERPFAGNGRMSLMLATTQGDRRPVPKSSPVPAWISEAIVRGLSSKSADRWPDMAALLEQLERQPPSRRAWLLGGLGAVVATGIVVASTGSREDPCDTIASETPLRPEVNDAMRDAFERADVPFADQALAHAQRSLDTYAQAWTAARVEVCQATRVRGDRSETVHDLSVACLDRRRRDFEAAAQVLAEADAATVEQSAALLDRLQPLAPCQDVESLISAYPGPDPERAEAVEAAETILSRGRALLGARRDTEAVEVLREAKQAAEQSEYLPTLANAEFELALAMTHTAQREAAMQGYHRAALLATRIGDDALLADVWLKMGRHLFQNDSEHDRGFQWFDYAEAVLDRLDDAFTLESELREARGTALAELGRLDEALAELDRLEAGRPQGERSTFSEELLRGNIYTWKADFDAAEAAFERAAERLRERHGEAHPLFSAVHNGRGVLAYSRGDLADAEMQFHRAYDTAVATLPEDSQDLLFSLGNIGEIQRLRGDYENAYASMLAVERIVTKSFPAVHREVGTTNHNIASVLRDWGKPEPSLPRYDVALEVRRKVHGERHMYVANTLTGKALALLDLDRPKDALPLLEEALSIRGETEAPPRKHAQTEFGLARALAETGGDLERARVLARTARGRLVSQSDEAVSERIAEIDRWLSAHGGDADDEPTPPARP